MEIVSILDHFVIGFSLVQLVKFYFVLFSWFGQDSLHLVILITIGYIYTNVSTYCYNKLETENLLFVNCLT